MLFLKQSLILHFLYHKFATTCQIQLSLAPQYLSDLFVRLSGVHPRELRNSKTDLAIPMFRTGNGQRSFAYRGASLWNSLDLETKVAPSINAFKSKLKEK